MDFFNSAKNLDIRKVQIPDLPNPRKPGFFIQRTPKTEKGMAELVNIVAGLQKGIKRINQCLTKAGGEAYIAKNNKKGLNAYEGAIT